MNSSEAWKTVNEMIRGFSASLPRLIFALVVVIFFYFLSYVVKAIVRRTTSEDSSHRTLRIAMGRIVQGAIIVIGDGSNSANAINSMPQPALAKDQ